jgi:hypothetical protein
LFSQAKNKIVPNNKRPNFTLFFINFLFMRFVKDITNTFCKTSLYVFNNKYIIKFEAGLLEQSYKVSEFDVSGDKEVEQMLTDTFYAGVIERFKGMSKDFNALLD